MFSSSLIHLHCLSIQIILRRQDVSLLKQFIDINEALQNLRQRCRPLKPSVILSPDSGINVDATIIENDVTVGHDTLRTFDEKRRLPLVRQQSVPYYLQSYNQSFNSVDTVSIASSFDGKTSCSKALYLLHAKLFIHRLI